MQSAIVKSLSLTKQQNSQAASLAKQQKKVQGVYLNYIALNLPNQSLKQHQKNKHHQKHLYANQYL